MGEAKVYTVTVVMPEGKILKEDALESILMEGLGAGVQIEVQEVH